MYRTIVAILCILVLSGALVAQDHTPIDTPEEQHVLDIPYEKFVLDNGLTLIVHEDHKAPIVAVNVWYHVGSKNEKVGKTGFAHLFEHLMFNGSENFNDDYFKVLERVGATDLNGTTNRDRTNYFQNVPVNALDRALWMESDRMGHLKGAISQDKLDEQRGVVQNEKRQGEDQPYGRVWNVIAENTFPTGHPYSWSVIGSMDDLNAASLDDVHEWFDTYYGAANAVLAIAGDIDPETAREKVEAYFGDISSGPPLTKPQAWIAKRSGEQRMTMQDRVPQSRIYKVWNVPEWGHLDHDHLEMVGEVLSTGKNARFYKRLVYDDQTATDVSAYVYSGEIASQFVIQASVRPGVDPETVESALDDELALLLAEGPGEMELERVKTQLLAGFVRGAERIGGFGGKSDILAQFEVYGGEPDRYEEYLGRIQSAAPADLKEAANRWLSDGVFVLEVHPFPEYTTLEPKADRSALPGVGEPPRAEFPDRRSARLSNGLDVILAQRDAVPVVNMQLILDAGYAADQFASPGTASLALSMLDEGTTEMTALEISEQLALLGATLGTGSDLDASYVSMSALKSNIAESLDLFADVILNPSFPESDFQRLKQQQLVRIQREKATPIQMALRVFPGLLYGDNHAYGNPLTGSGTEESTAALTTDDLKAFHDTWFRPNNATLVVVGDVSMDELQPLLEERLGNWSRGDVPDKNIQRVPQKSKQVVYLMDRPQSEQSIIFAGHVAPPKANPDEVAIQTMNTILGGSFTSRVNMNLREEKGWSYGAFTLLMDAKGQRPFIAYAPVQTDKTLESVQEIASELSGIQGTEPVTEDEVGKAQDNLTLTLPGQWETNNAVLNSIAEMVQYGLPDDHFDTYADLVRNLTVTDVSEVADSVLHPDNLVWVIVGDRAAIEAPLRDAGFDIQLIDNNGQPL